MAIFHVVPGEHYTLWGVIDYIKDQVGHDNKVLMVEGIGVNSYNAANDMYLTKYVFGKVGGSQYKHLIFSFSENGDARGRKIYGEFYRYYQMRLFYDIANYLYHLLDCQVIYAVHDNKKCLHAHYVINSVNYRNGSKVVLHFQDLLLLISEINNYCEKCSLEKIIVSKKELKYLSSYTDKVSLQI